MKKTFQWKEFLRTHPIFGTLRDNKRIDALLQDDVSSERLCAKDEVIVRQGEVGISVFLIGAGTAEATLGNSTGQGALHDPGIRRPGVRAAHGRVSRDPVSPPVNDKSASQEHGRA